MSEEKKIMVKLVNGQRPPNFEKILAVFPMAAGAGVVFAYGDKIYNPSGNPLPPELMAHELVHCERQIAHGVEVWWDQYLTDLAFCYDEELFSHIAEFKAIMSKYPSDKYSIGRIRESALDHVAKKLAAPLYKGMVTFHQARTAIRKGAAS